ncbi:RHS repeat-associated core domain-containing protein [Shewanella baltica OS183]|uniref:RHS repeat domain-containing protein n=1 Tax=Shewanella baltica TaxID=62322 RepID=UPI0001E10C7C|nr:RHS repeat-associated core domain-containing protein [Shewanella baltica]AEG11333.1 RHS repeat-associated core domain protein [Shewanella baltica BA175]EHQ15136.1 RHS repeat-associated core domain-containing protein [Shewanella baltica OS183]
MLSQQYDVFSRLIAQQWQRGSWLHERSYSYSARHQLVQLHDSQTGQLDYEYNTLDQLIQKRHYTEPSQNEAYRWDSFGNPVGVVVSQDRLARYPERSLDESLAHYQYDASGNQLGVKGHKQQQQREFNGFNQLISLHNGQNLTRYEYDALGRRSAKITAAGRIDYLWDGNQLIGEHCQDRFTWYLYEPAGNGGQSYKPFALIVQGEVYYYQMDQLGTPFALLDQHNHLVWQASYSALGQATVSVNAIANPLRFQGQYYDEESGLHYNHFRYYDPQTGRFISQDPIGLLGGLNHYQYAPNHINWIDPLGLSCMEGAESIADIALNTAYFIGGVLKFGGDTVTGTVEAIIEAPTEIAYNALYTVVDTAYYPIDYVARPLGLGLGAVERTVARADSTISDLTDFAGNVSENWCEGDWQALGSIGRSITKGFIKTESCR